MVAYLGPRGTFTQAALLAHLPEADGRPVGSVDAALDAVTGGQVDAAMVPIENSVEGGVTATLDALAGRDGLRVIGEELVPITFVLAARPGTALDDVRRVGTHSHAWAQVRGFVHERLGGADYVPTLSTAAGAAGLAAGDAPYDAAVCAPIAAADHGLTVLAHDIGDNAAAVTRFVLVARAGAVPAPTGADKTSVVLYQRDDRAGGLLEFLEQFATRGINLTRLESRPTGRAMGSYCFSIDFEGHLTEARVGEALVGLRRVAADVRFLGSYPRADRTAASVPPEAGDAAFDAAQAWLRDLRR